MTNSWLFVRKSSCLAPWKISVTDVTAMVNQTGGNRSGLTGFGFGLGRYQTGPNLKFKFELKKMKISKKILKNTSRCDESNGVKFSQKFIHLV